MKNLFKLTLDLREGQFSSFNLYLILHSAIFFILVIFVIILYNYFIYKLQKFLQIRSNKQNLQIGFKFIKSLTLYHQNMN